MSELDRVAESKPIDWAKKQQAWDDELKAKGEMLRAQYRERKAREARRRAAREAVAVYQAQMDEGYARYLVAVTGEQGIGEA